MFSTATVTAFLFVVFLVGLGITIWIDRKKTYLSPPNLNFQDGSDEANGEGLLAEHEQSTETGDLRAKVSATGPGSATACSLLGYEHEYSGDSEKTMVVEIRLSYAFNIEAGSNQSKVKSKVEMFLNSENVSILQAALPGGESAVTTMANSVSEKTQRLAVVLNAGENLKAYIKVSAEIENAEGATSSAEVSANIGEVMYRDEIKPM